jgi:4-amino-4-deoxychorismate lyase
MHLERLQQGCQRLAISVDFELLRNELAIATAGLDNALIKIIITRQSTQRGYFGAKGALGNRLIQCFLMPPVVDKKIGVKLRFCSTRLAINPQLAGLKHLNRLEQVLARSEWTGTEFYEGLMMDALGRVIEGTMTNVFFQQAEHWVTPCLTESGVAGVYRRFIMERLAPKVATEVYIKSVTQAELLAAPAVFICNSVQGIVPVSHLNGVSYSVTAQLKALLAAEADYFDE